MFPPCRLFRNILLQQYGVHRNKIKQIDDQHHKNKQHITMLMTHVTPVFALPTFKTKISTSQGSATFTSLNGFRIPPGLPHQKAGRPAIND